MKCHTFQILQKQYSRFIKKIMIDHKRKFIFIHIPRTGGTSIEVALHGKNWFETHAPSKHLTVHAAKKIYEEYWDSYFKFSFVRNPWDRMISMLKYGGNNNSQDGIYEVYQKNGEIQLDKYIKKYINIEYDSRFFHENQFNDFQTKNNTVYFNILENQMDFIGKYENLNEDFSLICKYIGVKNKKLKQIEKSNRKEKVKYSEQSKKIIEDMCKLEIEYFDYSYEE